MFELMRRPLFCLLIVALTTACVPEGGGDGGGGDGVAGQSAGGAGGDGPPTGGAGGVGGDTPDGQMPPPMPGECLVEGLFEVEPVFESGDCEHPLPEGPLSIRRRNGTLRIDLGGLRDWVAMEPGPCQVTASESDLEFFNDAPRRRALDLEFSEDGVDGTYRLEGATSDNRGVVCETVWRIRGPRTGEAPETGAAFGEPCGNTACNGARCVFGMEDLCASDICLRDTTVAPRVNICTQECDDARPCPDGYLCLPVSISFDLPEGRTYCALWRPICGNGIIEDGEICDDGNTDPGDGCDGQCQDEGCGNGRLDDGEACDGDVPVPCSEDCQPLTPDGWSITAVEGASSRLEHLQVGALPGGVGVVAWTVINTADFDQPPRTFLRTMTPAAGAVGPALRTFQQDHDTQGVRLVTTDRVILSAAARQELLVARSDPQVSRVTVDALRPRDGEGSAYCSVGRVDASAHGDQFAVVSRGSVCGRGLSDTLLLTGSHDGDIGSVQRVGAPRDRTCQEHDRLAVRFSASGALGVLWRRNYCRDEPSDQTWLAVRPAGANAFGAPLMVEHLRWFEGFILAQAARQGRGFDLVGQDYEGQGNDTIYGDLRLAHLPEGADAFEERTVELAVDDPAMGAPRLLHAERSAGGAHWLVLRRERPELAFEMQVSRTVDGPIEFTALPGGIGDRVTQYNYAFVIDQDETAHLAVITRPDPEARTLAIRYWTSDDGAEFASRDIELPADLPAPRGYDPLWLREASDGGLILFYRTEEHVIAHQLR